MSLPFDISSRARACVIAKNQLDDYFIVQVNVDVLSVIDAEPSPADGSPQFHIQILTSANVYHCSCRHSVTTYPFQTPKLSISVKSSVDEKYYEHQFEVKILMLELVKDSNNPFDIPIPRIQFHIVPEPIIQVAENEYTGPS